MPLSSTITTFHTFVANTKARASQVNTNFSNLRGHSLPIDPNTATATDMTHNLGASSHRWGRAFLGDIDLYSSTSTAAILFAGRPDFTNGGAYISINGTIRFQVTSLGVDGSYLQTGTVARPSLAVNAATTTASAGQVALSATISSTSVNTATVYYLPDSTITIASLGGPILIGFVSSGGVTASAGFFEASANTITSTFAGMYVGIYRNTITSVVSFTQIYSGSRDITTTAVNNSGFAQLIRVPASAVQTIDIQSAGTYTYFASIQLIGSGDPSGGVYPMRLMAREL